MSVPEINELARRIARSDAEDAGEQRTIRQLLATLRDRVQGEKAHDVRLRLDSALLLTEYLGQMDGVGGDEILRIVSRLVASMDPYFSPGVTLRKQRDDASAPEMEQRGSVPNGPIRLERQLANHEQIMRALASESDDGTHAPRQLTQEDEEEHGLISDMLLGEILVQFGTINTTQVLQALELQQSGVRFGDALIQLGAATRGDIQGAIAYQENLGKEDNSARPAPGAPLPVVSPLRSELKLVSDMMLGDLLVRMGKITPEQLEQGLRAQRATGVRIGEALVQMRATTWKDVEEGLRIQSERRVSVK